MKVYKQVNMDISVAGKSAVGRVTVSLVMAEPVGDKGNNYRVHHPDNGYSVWPAEQFAKQHTRLSRQEIQLINMSPAELAVMGISDGG